MIIRFIHTPDDLKQTEIAKATYKRENSIITRLVKESDKLFGKNNWEQVPNSDISLRNIVGWYSRRIDGDDTIEAIAS